MKKKNLVVFVGLSGGVDSAVSAALLLKKGYEVIGVFIKTWHPNFLACNEKEERLDAMRVAAFLNIPFLTFDFEDIYKKEVADYMIQEYKMGRTPNPDVMCNKKVKFGAFLQKALAMGADFVATGHYAETDGGFSFFSALRPSSEYRGGTLGQLKKGKSAVRLFKGKDPSKDQSYFLWTLKREQLEKIIFPVGHLQKTQVRKLAKKFNLPVAEKKDSQGICFLGAVDLKEFLRHYIKNNKGKIVNEKGEEIGYHDGIYFYTLGERHGFTVTKKGSNDGAYYVVEKDVKKNILVVAQDPYPTLPLPRGRRGGGLEIKNTNWIMKASEPNKNYTAQIRYHGEFLPCKVKCRSRTSAEIIFTKPVMVAPGQSCVIYDKDVCLGGGVVI